MNQASTMRCQVTKYEVSLMNCSKIAIISSATTVTQHDGETLGWGGAGRSVLYYGYLGL